MRKITLGTDTLFDFDRSELKPRGRARLEQLASDINRAERVSTVKIVGHTDAKGTDAYNMRLGQRRADTVASYLASAMSPPASSPPTAWVNRSRSRPIPCPTVETTRKAALRTAAWKSPR